MDNLKATYNIDSKLWEFELIPNTPLSNELQIAFCSDTGPAKFTGLRFGYQLVDADKTLPGEAFLTGATYPTAGIVYEEALTTNPFTIDVISYVADTNYKLLIWAENNGERGEGEYLFSIPRPPKEYPSWTWDNNINDWVAPAPRPVGVPAVWSEDTQNWIEINNAELIIVKPIGFDSWTLSSETNSWIPPVPMPQSDVPLRWDEATLSWVPTSENVQ